MTLLQKVENEFINIIDSDMDCDKKLLNSLSLMTEYHAETRDIMKEGFGDLAIQNAKLNAELKEQNKALKYQFNQLQDQLVMVTEELQERKERERLIEEKKEKCKNQKRLSKREPITIEIYDSLIQSSQKLKYSNLFFQFHKFHVYFSCLPQFLLMWFNDIFRSYSNSIKLLN